MAKLQVPREQVRKVLLERIRAGETLNAQIKVAESNGGHRDWLDLFDTWRADTITQLKASYEGRNIALEFEFATERMEGSSPLYTFGKKKEAVQPGIRQLEAIGSRFERFDCGICIDGMDGNFEPVPMRFIDDRSENCFFQLENLDIESQ